MTQSGQTNVTPAQTERHSVTVLEVDATPVLRAIERARERMLPLKGVGLACAAVQEMQNIILAKDAFDDRVAEAQTKCVLEMVFPDGVPE